MTAVSPSKGSKDNRFGEQIIEPVNILNVYQHIQRHAPQDRIKRMAAGWNEDQAGILLVGLLTDGAYAGSYHVYDGGTRRFAAEVANGADYEMPCWIREMTEREAAEKFISFNKDSKQPQQYDLYRIGLEARRPLMLSVKSAFDIHKIVGGSGTPKFGNGEPGKVSALSKCMQIVDLHKSINSKKIDDIKKYEEASKHLGSVLRICRLAYDGMPDAHQGDLLQAVHRLLLANHAKLNQKAGRDRLVDRMSRHTLKGWQAKVNQAKATGGSDSRGNYLAHFIGAEYNKRWPETKKLVIPRFEPTMTTQTIVVVGGEQAA